MCVRESESESSPTIRVGAGRLGPSTRDGVATAWSKRPLLVGTGYRARADEGDVTRWWEAARDRPCLPAPAGLVTTRQSGSKGVVARRWGSSGADRGARAGAGRHDSLSRFRKEVSLVTEVSMLWCKGCQCVMRAAST